MELSCCLLSGCLIDLISGFLLDCRFGALLFLSVYLLVLLDLLYIRFAVLVLVCCGDFYLLCLFMSILLRCYCFGCLLICGVFILFCVVFIDLDSVTLCFRLLTVLCWFAVDWCLFNYVW